MQIFEHITLKNKSKLFIFLVGSCEGKGEVSNSWTTGLYDLFLAED